jgi:putative ABC transport system permease protein
MTGGEVREDMLKPLAGATSTIDLLRVIMAIVAAIIIGAVTYLSALERLRDFAVLKAIGGSSRTLALSLALQAVIAAVLAAVLGVVLALLLRGAFPIPVDLQPAALIAMPIVAALVGVIASLAALRRVLRVDPALAFGG